MARLIFIYCIFISTQVFAKRLCDYPLVGLGEGVADDLKLMKKVNRLENHARLLRKLSKDQDVAIHTKFNSDLIKMDAQLLKGETVLAKSEWNTLFRDVEVSSEMITQIDEIFEALRPFRGGKGSYKKWEKALDEANITDEFKKYFFTILAKNENDLNKTIKFLSKQSKSYESKLGSKFYEYAIVRKHLDELLMANNCNAKCKEEISELFKELGIGSKVEHEMFGSLLSSAQKKTLAEIESIMASHPRSLTTNLRRIRNTEFFRLLNESMLFKKTMRKISAAIYKSQIMGRLRLNRFFKFLYNTEARLKYFPDIHRVIRFDDIPANRLKKLKELNQNSDKDELLKTFSRRSDIKARETWNDLKNIAKSEDDFFFKRMENAEKSRSLLGMIGLESERDLFKLIGQIGLGGGVVVYFNVSPSSYNVESTNGEKPPLLDVVIDLDRNDGTDNDQPLTRVVVLKEDTLYIPTNSKQAEEIDSLVQEYIEYEKNKDEN